MLILMLLFSNCCCCCDGIKSSELLFELSYACVDVFVLFSSGVWSMAQNLLEVDVECTSDRLLLLGDKKLFAEGKIKKLSQLKIAK